MAQLILETYVELFEIRNNMKVSIILHLIEPLTTWKPLPIIEYAFVT